NQKKGDKKIGETPPGGVILRVWFLDEKHGFGVGLQKAVVETKDGGVTWTPVEGAAKPSANPAHAAYTHIAFVSPKLGLILGGSNPPRTDDVRLPAWMEPERAVKRRQIPTLKLQLQTLDGGATWTATTAPLFGEAVSMRMRGVRGLLVFGFAESFEWPSEVYRDDLTTGKSTLAFHAKDRRGGEAGAVLGLSFFCAMWASA